MENEKQQYPAQPQPELYPPPHYQQQQPYPPQQQPYPPQQQPYPPQQQPYPPQQQPYPQQPQAAVFVTPQQAPTVLYVGNRSYLNFTGAILFSCFVFWCCGWLLGLIAFILAMVGQSSASSGDEQSARSLLTASYVLSTIGMVVGIILIIVVIVLVTSAGVNMAKAASNPNFNNKF